jgi:DeoR family transcriptional regulator, fructose operon transcriptional repressor
MAWDGAFLQITASNALEPDVGAPTATSLDLGWATKVRERGAYCQKTQQYANKFESSRSEGCTNQSTKPLFVSKFLRYDGRTMQQAIRVRRIQEIFSQQEFVNFEELCAKFQASKSSIRRDLIELEEKGVLRRVHGGAISLQTRDEVMDFNRLSGSSHDEKIRIGKLAASLVQDGQTVLMSGGSTVVEVAKNLPDRAIQVVTNSIPVAQIFWDSKQVEVTLTGGYLYPRLGIQLGPICEKMLNSVSADILFLGIRGITDAGISDSNSLIVESIRCMIRASHKVVLVADHSKFGRNAMIHVAELSDVDQIITDSGIDSTFERILKDSGVECTVA